MANIGNVRERKTPTVQKNIFFTAGETPIVGGTLEIGHFVEPGTVLATKTIAGLSGRVGQKLVAPFRQTADVSSSADAAATSLVLKAPADDTSGMARNPMNLNSLYERKAAGETLTLRIYNTSTESATNYEDIAISSITVASSTVVIASGLSSATAVNSRVVLKDGSEAATDSTTGTRNVVISLDYVDTRYQSQQADALQNEANVSAFFATNGQLDFDSLIGWNSDVKSALPMVTVVKS